MMFATNGVDMACWLYSDLLTVICYLCSLKASLSVFLNLYV